MQMETLKNVIKDAEFRGWCDCLGSVRASLKSYPNGGGDIEIMEQVERIRQEAIDDYIGSIKGHYGFDF